MSSILAGVEACIPALRRYARALLRGNQQGADDLVHDTLVSALDNLDTRREGGEIRPWLFAIMHNRFVSQRRRAKRSSGEASLEEAEEARLAVPGGQEENLRWGEAMRALQALPQEQRDVILLVCVESLTYAQAARVLNVPIGTVMSRLGRGRERLRVLLQEDAIKPELRRVK